MDYCSTSADVILNECQQRRAANQRKKYMTPKGETDYYQMKGTRGEAICKQDSDCDDGEYCDKGVVAGIGRNQCKEKKRPGNGEPACREDSDCGSGQYCDKGVVAGVGRNQCKQQKEERSSRGREPACRKDSDCGRGQVCDKGVVAGIGRNHCRAKRGR
jgi:Cys-rich repeat protein